MGKILNWPIFILVFSYGSVNAMVVLDQIPDWLYLTISTIYRLIFSIAVVYLFYRTYRSLIIPFSKDYAERKGSKASRSFIPLMDIIGGMLIVVFGIMWILHYNGIDIMVFVAGLGIIGIILGIALQDTISNFFSGLWIMMDQPFSEGDVILYKEEYCRVLRTGFRSTRLYNILKHEYLVVPNNDLANRAIVNKNEPDLNLRIEMDVGVEYGSDVVKTKEIILEAINAQPSIVQDDFKRKPVVNFKKFGNDSLEFRAWYYVREVLDQWRTAGLVQEHIDKRFREEGIVVAFPQRTVSYLGDRAIDDDKPTVHTPPVNPAGAS
ncbi:MAG: mechanosensitive ion channel, partial [Thermoplasmata archaeon]|nr:mechanosensitive ion channel [Thermoplasmata archaeon]NIS10751.1 mechanosensitive ion channel [Thermoplasmata archaeon]NIS18691.1 mechanosensitive ion channel [Thermoplasmata archaeon]NIT75704.1 mechanosensitive ion channel [Thermoplasmata archaeon]NIU47852.1 mechanosensitive ion channel [Thermoplasmata archaeon]